MGYKIPYAGTGAEPTVGPSAGIWASCPWIEMIEDPGVGYQHWCDFLGGLPVPDAASATLKHGQDGIFAFATDAGVTALNLADEVGGVLELTTVSDDDEIYITIGENTGVAGVITANSGNELWFEARIKVNHIDNTHCGMMIGLAEEGLATTAAGIPAACATIEVVDFVGFELLSGDGDAINAIHMTNGGARVEIKAAAHVPVADTFVKFGIHFDGETTVTFYVNGVSVGTAETGDTNFPDGEEVKPFLGFKQEGAVAAVMAIDWWRFAQLR